MFDFLKMKRHDNDNCYKLSYSINIIQKKI